MIRVGDTDYRCIIIQIFFSRDVFFYQNMKCAYNSLREIPQLNILMDLPKFVDAFVFVSGVFEVIVSSSESILLLSVQTRDENVTHLPRVRGVVAAQPRRVRDGCAARPLRVRSAPQPLPNR